MARKILLGYDGSDPARRALDRAVEELRHGGGHLFVLAVLEMPLDPTAPRAYGTAGDGRPAFGPYVEPPEIDDLLGEARKRLEKADAPAEYLWAAGEPGQIIVDAAAARDVDLIVVGSGHHGFLGRLFGADVAGEVRNHAGCEVIAVE